MSGRAPAELMASHNEQTLYGQEKTASSAEANLSLAAVNSLIAERNAHERMQPIARTDFNRRTGTLLLELNCKRTLSTVLDGGQQRELKQEGFIPLYEPHITVLNYSNASRVIEAMDGQRRRLGSIAAEVNDVDWSWRPTGIIFPLRTKRSDGTKIISLVECPGAEDLFERLEDNLPGLQLERQPMHISLMRKKGEPPQTPINIDGLAIGKPLKSLDFLIPQGIAA